MLLADKILIVQPDLVDIVEYQGRVEDIPVAVERHNEEYRDREEEKLMVDGDVIEVQGLEGGGGWNSGS